MNFKNVIDTLSQSIFVMKKICHTPNGVIYILLKFSILLFNSIIGFIGIIIPGLIINELTTSIQTDTFEISTFIIYLVLLFVLPLVYHLILIPLETFIWKIGEEISIFLSSEFNVFVSKMDYESFEIPETQELRGRVEGTVQGSLEIIDIICNLASALISFFITFSIISYLNPFLVALILGMILINAKMTKWMNYKKFELRKEFSKAQRKIWSLSFMLEDFVFAKEVRVYNVVNMLLVKLNAAKRQMSSISLRNLQNKNLVSLSLKLTEFTQSTVVYIYMIYKVLFQMLPIGSMTIYLSASQQFSGAVSSITHSYLSLNERSMEIKEWKDFLHIKSEHKEGHLIPQICPDNYFEFRNVSFKYPGSDKYALQNINLKLSYREKLCIVGSNGSGKSTFIKLLLRLYEPTSGEIIFNGINIKYYDYESYKKLFAPVFQDFVAFEFSLKENIILSKTYDNARFQKVVDDVNLSDLINKLSKGAETQIGKEIDPEGIEPSGGEGQRIAIARACYHDGEVFVLDEPTAALDPNTEYEIYTQFNNMITNKCAILVTHRLSAVQLADKVAVFDNGQVVEYGTHKELYAANGIYTEMFDKQAQFYRDNPAESK